MDGYLAGYDHTNTITILAPEYLEGMSKLYNASSNSHIEFAVAFW